MTAVTIRKLTPEVHQALRDRAKTHGHSTEAEIRLILETAVLADMTVNWVDELQAIGNQAQITTEFENLRDKTPARIWTFD